MKRQILGQILASNNVPMFFTPKFVQCEKSYPAYHQNANQNSVNSSCYSKSNTQSQSQSQSQSHSNSQSQSQFQSLHQYSAQQFLQHLFTLEQRNTVNQRLIVELRRLYQKQKTKTKSLEIDNQILQQKLFEEHQKFRQMKQNIYSIYLQKEQEERKSKENIIKLSEKVQEIPYIIEGIISHRMSRDGQTERETQRMREKQRQETNRGDFTDRRRRVFSLKNFKNNMVNGHQNSKDQY